jgi:predicted nicotinamide N-methyase
LAAKVPLVELAVSVGRRDWSILAVEDHDALLADTSAFAHTPYGLLLWESAIALARFLARQGEAAFAGRTVLELGCGVGLPGLVAAAHGAVVTQSDHEPHVLTVARENARRNGIHAIKQTLADWSNWSDPTRYDVIIGSDIGYGVDMHDALLAIFEANLATDGTIILSDPSRDQSLVLLGCLERAGWRVSMELDSISDASGRPNMPPVAVKLVTVRRPVGDASRRSGQAA